MTRIRLRCGSKSPRLSGDHLESRDMIGSHNGEITPVQGRDHIDLQSLGNSDNRRVDRAEPKIGVPLNEIDDTGPIVVGQVDSGQLAWWIARKNATSGDGPSRDSISQAVSVMTEWEPEGLLAAGPPRAVRKHRDQDRRGRQRRIRRPCRQRSHVTRLLVSVLLTDDFAVTPANRLAGT